MIGVWPRGARPRCSLSTLRTPLSSPQQIAAFSRLARATIFGYSRCSQSFTASSSRSPYEFGCKVSIATPVTAPKGGRLVLYAKALHGNPYDGHTLGVVIADLEKLTGVEVRRIHGDKGYRGHNHPDRFKVGITGQVRRVTKAICREMCRRAAVEPVIGHLKDDHRMGRNYLKGRGGDRINAVLAAAGHNFAYSDAGSSGFCAPCG
jgi:hypothetical protein